MSYGPLRIVRQPRAFGDVTVDEKVQKCWQRLAATPRQLK